MVIQFVVRTYVGSNGLERTEVLQGGVVMEREMIETRCDENTKFDDVRCRLLLRGGTLLQYVSYPPTGKGTHTLWTWTRPWDDVHFDRTYEGLHTNVTGTAKHLSVSFQTWLALTLTSCYLRRLVRQYTSVAFTRVREDGTTEPRRRPVEAFLSYSEDFYG